MSSNTLILQRNCMKVSENNGFPAKLEMHRDQGSSSSNEIPPRQDPIPDERLRRSHTTLKRKNNKSEDEGRTTKEAAAHSNKAPSAGKKKKIDLTLEWLEENYMICEGVCLARCILYSHYRDFCEKNGLEPACAATFGKTIRQKFPRVTTRRLGMRGHSKYHYYGIGIRETSVYYSSVYAGKGLTRYSPKIKPEDEIFLSSQANTSKENLTESFLDEVPDVSAFISEMGNKVLFDQIQMQMNMYKCFCRQIVAAAETRDYALISNSLLQFWSDFPFQQFPHLLHNTIAMDITTLCDVLLYEALIEILLPVPCDNIEERHLTEIGNLGKQLDEFLKASSTSPFNTLLGKKMVLAQQFSQFLMRHVTFIKLNRAVCSIFSSAATFLPLRNDLEKINLHNSIGSQTLYSATSEESKDTSINNEWLKELKDLLSKNATVELLVEWLDSVVDSKVIKPSKQNGRSLKKRAQDFLLKWSFFGARITHNLNNANAPSFNSFHYLRMFFVEYVMLAIETQFINEKRQDIKKTVTKYTKSLKTTSHSATSNSKSVYRTVANTTKDLKPDLSVSGAPKKWDPLGGYWSTHPNTYDSLPKSHITVDGCTQFQYDLQPTIAYHQHTNQTLPLLNHPQLTSQSSSCEASNLVESCSKRRYDEIIYENGSSFTKLNGETSVGQNIYTGSYYANNQEALSRGYRPGSTGSLKEVSYCDPAMFENKRICPNSYSNFYESLRPPSVGFGASPHHYFAGKTEQNSIDFSDANLHPQCYFPDKDQPSDVTDNNYLIQDLSYSGQCHAITGPPPVEYFLDSRQKSECKVQQNDYRRINESFSSSPVAMEAMTSSQPFDDSYFYSGGYNAVPLQSGTVAVGTEQPPLSFDKTFSVPFRKVDSTRQPPIYQENLPSISSVLSVD